MSNPTQVPIRAFIAAIILISGIAGIGYIFWIEDLRYATPTPVPANYVVVSPGKKITHRFNSNSKTTGAQFLHFYSPNCPCSRFNAKHLRELAFNYHDSIDITIVVRREEDKVKALSEFGQELNCYIDSDLSLAKVCGVYSTPQAVVIDQANQLYYRGNYNQSRFCTARATNYAELALIALLNNQPPPVFDLLATQSYGCELENEHPELTIP